MESLHYRVGIDVGSFSVGMAAIEVDKNNFPIRLLSAVSHIHDSGLDKDGKKKAETRRAASGVARRMRRLVRQRRRRMKQLDRTLTELGYPIADVEGQTDPYLIWRVRAQLVEEVLPEETRRYAISMALRHIARHRGWRNPYVKTESLVTPAAESDFMTAMRDRIIEATGEVLADDLTPGQAMCQVALNTRIAIRGPRGVLGKLHQSDNANEIRRICEVQGVSSDECETLILAVFAAKSPRGSALKNVGKDPLPGQGAFRRAAKCDPEFQRYRIISIVANLRLRDGGEKRPLSVAERGKVVKYLLETTSEEIGWVDVAEVLGVPRQNLLGTASLTPDGERAAAQPPVDVTDRIMRRTKVKELRQWWVAADKERRSAMISYLYEGLEDSECSELIGTLPEKDLGTLDSLHLPAGRAAYSRESLKMLNDRMMSTEDDVHAARKHVFGVDDSWVPPAEPIGAPVGNPAVDRTVKQVSRFLEAAKRAWGEPVAIQIEHVREGFASEKTLRELDRENNKRFVQNSATVAKIISAYNIEGRPRRSDVRKYEAVMLQDCVCVYCGGVIDYLTAQMDHIVPQAGPGSNNHRDNLVAVCERCNKAKSNTPFAVWAASCGIPGVSQHEAIERVKAWRNLPKGMGKARLYRLKRDVSARLKRTQEDPPLDERSMESVAWMANELRHRVAATFPSADVRVYRGSLTAGARKVAGIDNRVNLLGEKGKKDRLDRRHHVVDALVIALMRPSVAKTLAERSNLREAQRIANVEETWKQYTGSRIGDRRIFDDWLQGMHRLIELINVALAEDRVPVTENLRLRLGNGSAHDDTVRQLVSHRLGDGLTAAQVDRAATPALWCALTRQPDFTFKEGLPVSEDRSIRVHGKRLTAADEVAVFSKHPTDLQKERKELPFAAIAVRGGYAEVGSTIHHARIFRIESKKPSYSMLRVFACDLLKSREKDLFAAEVPPQSISVRCAEPKLRAALANGTAVYLGWIVVGDEIEVPMDSFTSGQIGGFRKEFPTVSSWRVRGFFDASRLRLRPTILSSEGVTDRTTPDVLKMLDRPGWICSINVLATAHPQILRRDVLGRPRTSSDSGLPVCWTLV